MSTTLTGWRIAIAQLKDGKPYLLESNYTKEKIPFPTNDTLEDSRGFHVGTSRDFCTDYYQGGIDPDPIRKEILFELEILPKDLQTPEMAERWEWPCPTEAIVKKAKIVKYEILE